MAVAKNEDELKELSRSLNEFGFKEADTVSDLLDSKSYIVVKEDSGKIVYDFAAQYPTGQIEIFNKEKMQSKVFAPDYANSIVLLIEEKDLKSLSAKGLDLLLVAGPAYRN